MASRSFATLQGSGRNTLDVPVAALAGLAIAFLAFAIPANLLAEIVSASGLPSIVAAAEPPLGFKARIGLGAAGAVIVFALTFLVLRWLERFGRRRVEEKEELELEIEAPRLRRRDIHPDAPSRPPLLAVHELGEPDLELDEAASSPWLEPAAPSPVWDKMREEPAREPRPMPEPEPQVDPAPAFEPSAREEESDAAAAYALSQYRWSGDEEPETQPAPPVEHAWIPEPPAEEPAAEEPTPFQPEVWATEPAMPPAPESEPPASPEPWHTMPSAATEAAEPDPEPAEAPQPPQGSIADLMERLEQGLARRRVAPFPAAVPEEDPAPPSFANEDDDRLQNAINSLQRFASRQD